MSAAAPAAPADAAAAPAAGGKKKLIIIIVAALVLVLGGGGAAFMLLKKPPAEEGAEDEGGGHKTKSKSKAEADHAAQAPRSKALDPKKPPVFVPLDAFTVNLADKDSDRYAQVGITLELDDPKIGDELKVFMPAIRNNILMVLSHKTAAQLLTREGKDKLARSILFATVRPLGFPTPEEDDDEEDEDTAPKKKKKKRQMEMVYPVTAVHFSTFIIQ